MIALLLSQSGINGSLWTKSSRPASWLNPILGTLFLTVFHIVLTRLTCAVYDLDCVFQQTHYMIGRSKYCMKIWGWIPAGWIYVSCITRSDGWQVLNCDDFSTDKCFEKSVKKRKRKKRKLGMLDNAYYKWLSSWFFYRSVIIYMQDTHIWAMFLSYENCSEKNIPLAEDIH